MRNNRGALVLIIMGLAVLYSTNRYRMHRAQKEPVDMVVFSYNRPLQLYAFLESAQKNITNAGEVTVVFRADEPFVSGYNKVQALMPAVRFLQQSSQQDFKPLTLEAAFMSPHNYVVFAVDDIVVKEPVDLGECSQALEYYDADGFYLRLGKHVTECYMSGRHQGLPPLFEQSETILAWEFVAGRDDWSYVHSLDMTVYRKKDIHEALASLDYTTPNQLEGRWWVHPIKASKGLCYATSRIVNLPLNCVQDEYDNRSMQALTPEQLLAQWEQGNKMAIEPLQGWQNNAAHMEYQPQFVALVS